MSERESAFKVARNLKPPETRQVFAAHHYILKQVATGLYYVRDHGFCADIQSLASVVGSARAAMLVANSPKGSVETIPVAGRPMLS